MSNREDRLRSLLDKVRAKRPEERTTHAADALERMRTASGTTAAAVAPSSPPLPPAAQPTPVPSAFPTQAAPQSFSEPQTSQRLESPTRYSSQPPRVERPLSVEPRTPSVRPISATPSVPSPAPTTRRPESIRPQSVAPTGQPVVYATDPPEFPRPKTFGDLLELTLSLRPR
jgi:hypothetical protein